MKHFFTLSKLKMFLMTAVLMYILIPGWQSMCTAETAYEDKLFDPSFVHNIEINMSPEDWADLKANPLLKTKYRTDIIIDG